MMPRLLLSLALMFLSRGLHAEEKPPIPAVKQLFVRLGGTVTVVHSSGRDLRTVTSEDPKIAELRPGPDNKSARVKAMKPGTTRLHLTDVKGVEDISDVIIRRHMFLLEEDAQEFHFPKEMSVKNVQNPGKHIQVKKALDTKSAVKVTAIAAGDTYFVVEAEDATKEIVLVTVLSQKLAGKNLLLMHPGDTRVVGMSTKKDLRTVISEDPEEVTVYPGPDNSHVRFIADRVGMSRVTITDIDNKQETFEVVISKRAPVQEDSDSKKAIVGEKYHWKGPGAGIKHIDTFAGGDLPTRTAIEKDFPTAYDFTSDKPGWRIYHVYTEFDARLIVKILWVEKKN